MRARVFWLGFFRFLVLLFSLATLACNIVNLVFVKTTDWFPEYVPYILYIVGPGVSIICSLALNIVSISSVKSTRGDRTLSILNLALMIAVIVYNTLKSGVVPWTPQPNEDAPSSATPGFATYCSNYHNSTDANRCWLTDGMWLGSLLIAAFWLLLAIYVYAQKSSDIYDDDYDVYDFKEDVPMAVTSPTAQHDYHASSPTHGSSPKAAAAGADYNAGGYYGQGYREYDSYYDYPPQSPYGGYSQPAATAGGYSGGGGAYAYNDTAHMLSENAMEQQHPQYYSPHLNNANVVTSQPVSTPGTSTVHTHQTPNAY